ncbi:MAG: NAD-glutamate dehydrogenase [Xanthobacter sp.]
MTIHGFPEVDTSQSIATRINEVRALLAQEAAAGEGQHKPVPESFTHTFLAAMAPEDLLPLAPSMLATMIRSAWRHVSAHRPGHVDIHLHTPEPDPTSDSNGTITVIEAVNDDMAFLFDSVVGAISARGIELKLAAHPILHVERDVQGQVLHVKEPPRSRQEPSGRRESLIHLHIPAISPAEGAQLKAEIAETLMDVRAANEDFRAMHEQVQELARRYRAGEKGVEPDEAREAADLLSWLAQDNFIFLGLRHYDIDDEGGLLELPTTGLGVLRDPSVHELRLGDIPVVTTPEIRAFLASPQPLLFTKASLRSRVHRRGTMDYVGVKTHDAEGRITGEIHVIGLLTASAYTHSVWQIPYLRLKADAVMKAAGLEPESHSARALATALETYPRDDLFQIDNETLLIHSREILSLYDRPRVRLLLRQDRFDRFVSALVYVPHDRFDIAVRARIGEILSKAFGGRVTSFAESYLAGVPLTRVHVIIGRNAGSIPDVDRAALEAEIADATFSWSDRLSQAIISNPALSKDRLTTLQQRYSNAFGAGYISTFDVETALADIEQLERLTSGRPIAIDFYRRDTDPDTRISLRLLSHGEPLPLSTRVPMLENMGLRAINERTFRITPVDEERCWLHDMTLERADGGSIAITGAAERLEDCLNAVLRGEAENDGFNALVSDASLSWREAALVRTLGRYLRQVGIPFSQDYLWATMGRHEELTRLIVALFHARFDPALDGRDEARTEREAPLRAALEDGLSAVFSLDEDRILRHFINLVDATLRTSFYQSNDEGCPRESIAIKLESAKVDGLPLPRPLYEVFVYSPRVEGVHLRFGKVARGGLRWSDRPQDFRTEILGLVKAQQVKNAVIVPVGAKGGFVPKCLPAGGSREAVQAEGRAAYEVFISALLDLADNLKEGSVVHPAHTVRLDGDDPYLVVAADKGTATFSDTANALSQRHGFWLDDAFASGGSVGYDHKAMGITARGAWEAVKRHFREMDIDIQTSPVTVVGVGDMSGDVFGNGMLLSSAIKLVAAFDHRHIFLDPDPDPAASHAERQRLFDMPRSSWADYNAALISEGGGIFPRDAKSIPLSQQVQEILNLHRAKVTPAELISAILKAPADLLFFGGIGTYIRATAESDAQVGDRANDAIRISASELNVKVIGEGANLGVTQRGRIEAARRGVRLNSDAIDNSAGVNTSDVEVNIKIALSHPLAQGKITMAERAALLKEMTPEVARLVLRNNYLQTLAISLAERQGADDLPFQQRMMQLLEVEGALDRQVEALPSDTEIADRRSRGEHLTRPELAVLLAYGKLTLNAALVASNVPDDPYLARQLITYFPKELQERFPEAIHEHRLHREIIATGLSNAIINLCGPASLARIADQTGADAAALARAFAAVRDSYDLTGLKMEVDALDNKVSGAVQLALYATVQELAVSRIVWFLGNVSFSDGIATVVDRYRASIGAVIAALDDSLPENYHTARQERIAELVAEQVPEPLARRIGSMKALAAAADIAHLAQGTGRPIPDVARTFFAVVRYFGVGDIMAQAGNISAPDYYDRLALDRSAAQLETFLRRITGQVLAHGSSGQRGLTAYVEAHRDEVERMHNTIRNIVASGLTLSKMTLAASLLGDLVHE